MNELSGDGIVFDTVPFVGAWFSPGQYVKQLQSEYIQNTVVQDFYLVVSCVAWSSTLTRPTECSHRGHFAWIIIMIMFNIGQFPWIIIVIMFNIGQFPWIIIMIMFNIGHFPWIIIVIMFNRTFLEHMELVKADWDIIFNNANREYCTY